MLTGWRPRPRDERGAYAVLYGLLAVVLLGMAGLAVDIGNATARKSDVQGQADFGALAAATELGAEYTPAIKAAALNAVAESFNLNQPLDGTCSGCVSATDLDDDNLVNGEVDFLPEGVRVWSPQDQVDFGFANALGFSSTNVQGSALVDIFSPGGSVMPMFAVSGCDYGRQSITDPASGPVPPTIPALAWPTDANSTELDRFTDSTGAQTNQVELNPLVPPVLTLHGSQFRRTTKIGFFHENGSAPVEIPNLVHPVPALLTPYTAANGSISFTVPTAVSSVEAVWYVRVFNEDGPTPSPSDDDADPADPNGGPDDREWSPMSEAIPLRVGASVLECAALNNDGNFGTLALPRADTTPSEDLAVNISDSLEPPLTLAVHEQADATGLCTDGVNGAITSEGEERNPGTNCVDTDTGLPAGAATDGLVLGTTGGGYGRLDVRRPGNDTNPDCGRSNTTMRIQRRDYTLNNDVLTCFLADGTTSLATITSPSYSGAPALIEDIYLSPRFFWLPVLSVEPSSGGSLRYSIVDFRPGFITDELVAPTSIRGSNTATADNGLYRDTSGENIIQIKVIFFDIDALPLDTPGPVVNFIGVGPKLVRLID